MAEFWVYDIVFLVAFTIFVFWFLRKEKKNISREGIIFLYRTKLGIGAINYVGKKFRKILDKLVFPIIFLGVLLMGVMLWMLGRTLSVYIIHPEITKIIKAPPIAPLIPYFPKIFGMSNFFPPFYFTYFIVSLAIVAIAHEFSHGVFMSRFKIKIKSTGLVFLGPILGAFVEEEKKNFAKKKKVEQMAVLAAGVFANATLALVFYGLYVLFFLSMFVPSGYVFSTYSLSTIPVTAIENPKDVGNFLEIHYQNRSYLMDKKMLDAIKDSNFKEVVVYDDAPAIRAKLESPITRIDNFTIRSVSDLQSVLKKKKPGEEILIYTFDGAREKEHRIVLAEHPQKKGVAFLGVGNFAQKPKGIVQKFFSFFMGFKNPQTYYKPIIDGNFSIFILNFIWWIMVINLLVALFNMLPLGMLDGGRFFYLLVWGVTGSEKAGEWAYKAIGYAIIVTFILMMFYWGVGVF
ncbi:hypothetical protein D6829_01545 [Candidatus Pacearchaeota archaeon]|nr:MAG: hypothetical protein D6829_01545 [Candidatus Pacearchaeota archaeon]